MTIETAKKASNLLSEIRELEKMKTRLERAHTMYGTFEFSNGGMDTFSWIKGRPEGIYVNFIIDGVQNEIQNLETKIKQL